MFADGPVGRAAVEWVLSTHPGDLRLLVTTTSDFAESILRDRQVTERPIILLWDELLTDAGERRTAALELDTIVLAWWPFLLRAGQLGLARRHVLNLHPSLLPAGRGKDPNFWALVEERPFGVTLHHVDSTVDGGDVAFQARIPVTWLDTGETLYRQAEVAMLELFKSSYSAIAAGSVPRIPQGSAGTSHRRAELEPASRLELDRSYRLRDLLNVLRARTFPPHPGCRFQEGEDIYEVRVAIQKVDRASQ
jgi:methionyl-tRNA formyltransferase